MERVDSGLRLEIGNGGIPLSTRIMEFPSSLKAIWIKLLQKQASQFGNPRLPQRKKKRKRCHTIFSGKINQATLGYTTLQYLRVIRFVE